VGTKVAEGRRISGRGRRRPCAVRFGEAERPGTRIGPRLALSVNGVAQSYVDLDDPEHLEFDYVRRIGDVVDLVHPAGWRWTCCTSAAGRARREVRGATRKGSRSW